MGRINKRQIGTQDILPDEIYKRQYIEKTVMEISSKYGFKEMRVPTFEATEVFTGSVGESSDIVNKEMYTFTDKGNRSITLRPELTAGTTRAMIEHGLLNQLPQKISSIGHVFRYERPQAGRYREFNQINMEIFGPSEPTADAELISLAQDILVSLGIEDIMLRINSIGCEICRVDYLEKLKIFFSENKEKLDEDSLSRLDTNPMRILDSKIKSTINLVKDAPKTVDNLCHECEIHFNQVLSLLKMAEVDYEIDPLIVRGLDYYTKTVFEFISNDIGSQGTVCGGGRYDTLIEKRGGFPTPALGFGMGLERLLLVMEALDVKLTPPDSLDIFIVSIGASATNKAFSLSNRLRKLGLSAQSELMGRSVKAQMRYANRLNSLYTIVLGQNELEENKASLRNMETREEVQIDLNADEIATKVADIELENVKKV